MPVTGRAARPCHLMIHRSFFRGVGIPNTPCGRCRVTASPVLRPLSGVGARSHRSVYAVRALVAGVLERAASTAAASVSTAAMRLGRRGFVAFGCVALPATAGACVGPRHSTLQLSHNSPDKNARWLRSFATVPRPINIEATARTAATWPLLTTTSTALATAFWAASRQAMAVDDATMLLARLTC